MPEAGEKSVFSVFLSYRAEYLRSHWSDLSETLARHVRKVPEEIHRFTIAKFFSSLEIIRVIAQAFSATLK